MTYEEKLNLTKTYIIDWYCQFKGKVYVSFSGGKDSTILLHIARGLYPDIKGCFIDTGLEYPEIRNFVRTFENIDIIKPKKTFKQVIEEKGYPVISKEQAQYIRQARTGCENTRNRRIHGDKNGRFKISNKWRFLLEAPFKISEECCNILKKNPAKKYEKETGLKCMLGVRGQESMLRRQHIPESGCKGFFLKRPLSKPLIEWSEEDVNRYIKENKVEVCNLYKQGYTRTGCMFCMFGCMKKEENKFELMKKTHPKLFKYCMEKLGLKSIFEYIQQGLSKNGNC